MRLARQEVVPGHRDWFARARLDVIDWYPVNAHNLAMAALLSLLAGASGGAGFCAAVLAVGTLPVLAALLLYRRRGRAGATDHVRLLRTRAGLFLANAVGWGLCLGWAFAVTGPTVRAPILALALYVVVMAALTCMAIPFVGTIALAAMTALVAAGLVAGCGSEGAVVAALFALLAHSLYSVKFNLYYMFATRRLRTRTLREANETVQLLLSEYDTNSSDWLWQTDEEGRFVMPSARFAAAAGLAPDDLAGSRISRIAPRGSELRRLYTAIRARESFRDLALPVERDGTTRWWMISGRAMHDAAGRFTGYRGFASDQTASREADERIAYMAHFDLLTGLGNRASFNARLEQALATRRDTQQLAVLYVDLDHFKSINDGYGHVVGDQVLALAASRIAAQLGPRDTAARLGGDEFAVLLPGLQDQLSAVALAERIVTAVAEPMEVERLRIAISASIGIAYAPSDATAQDAILRCADLALYHAKEQGRACASVYDRDMHEAMQERRTLTSDLRLALSRGELELYYQPLVDIGTGDIEGYEALLRWHHPVLGMVPPSTFIPIAEETGLIVPIGDWIIKAAIEELATWPEHLAVAINLSPVQVRHAGLIPHVIRTLAASGVAPGRVEFEITESVLLHESEDNVAALHRLRDIGTRISLDDFGTGYSSLNYLRSFPFDKIKIDRSFVDSIADRPENQAIVDAVVTLACNLRIGTTAEGVETESQLAELRRNGCRQAQGYLFDQARPAHALPFRQGEDRRLEMPPGQVVRVLPSPAKAPAGEDPGLRTARQRKG